MERVIWAFMIIDFLAGVLLLILSMRSGQDAAGKGMIALPILALIVIPIVAYFLIKADYKILALILTGIPAVIVAFATYITLSQGKGGE